jgi:hypothetical protein
MYHKEAMKALIAVWVMRASAVQTASMEARVAVAAGVRNAVALLGFI